MSQEQVPVLIVGAGAAGLSLSLLLLQQGIDPLLIERRADISIYPRARNLNFRTLEVFRGLGLAAEVRAAGTRISQVIFKECEPSGNSPGLPSRNSPPRSLFCVLHNGRSDVQDPAWRCPRDFTLRT